MRRRKFLLGAAFNAAAFSEPALFALTVPPSEGAARVSGRRVGMADVEILTERVTQLRQLDYRYGSGRLREQVVALLHREANQLLHGTYSEKTVKSLSPDGEPRGRASIPRPRASDLGKCLRDLGEAGQAITLSAAAAHDFEPWRVRARCFAQTDLAGAHLLGNDLEQAAALGRDALRTAAQVSSVRTLDRFRTLQRQVQPLRVGSPHLRELDERITDFLTRSARQD